MGTGMMGVAPHSWGFLFVGWKLNFTIKCSSCSHNYKMIRKELKN